MVRNSGPYRIVASGQWSCLEWRGVITSDSNPGERVRNVSFPEGEGTLRVDLLDGRAISVPLAWYPRLLHATPEQRNNWKIIGAGFGIHWPDVDEDLSTEGLLRGQPAPGAGRGVGKRAN